GSARSIEPGAEIARLDTLSAGGRFRGWAPPLTRPGSELDEPLRDRVLDERRLRVQVELAHDVVTMRLDRVGAQHKLGGDFGRRLALGDEQEDLALPVA